MVCIWILQQNVTSSVFAKIPKAQVHLAASCQFVSCRVQPIDSFFSYFLMYESYLVVLLFGKVEIV